MESRHRVLLLSAALLFLANAVSVTAFTPTRPPVYATSLFGLTDPVDALGNVIPSTPVAKSADSTASDPVPVPDCHSDHSSTVWMCISVVLVLGMSPALALFEAGMLRSKSTVSLITQVFAGVITLSVLWVCLGFTLTFGDSMGGVLGNLQHAFFINVSYSDCSVHAPQIPQGLFSMFQMMFAVITPLLMTGAFAERMKFRSYMAFIVSWEILVYYPLAHWIWGGGYLGKWGVLDFAGGIVIHTSAGIGSLVCALYLGRRANYYDFMGEFPPSNLPLAATGAALLWIGWFGFNGGSALAAGPVAVSALTSTQIGCSCGAFTWLVIGWYREKPQAAALMNGALAGLAGITPASGYVNTPATILLGVIFGASSYFSVVLLKHKLHVDDALDVSSVHGLTGVIGSLAIGLFAQKAIDPAGADGLFYGHGMQLVYQFVGVLVTLVYAGGWTYILLKIIDRFMGLRVSEEAEEVGLDWALHHEVAYHKLHVLDDPSIADEPTYVNGQHVGSAATTHTQADPLNESLLAGNIKASDVALNHVSASHSGHDSSNRSPSKTPGLSHSSSGSHLTYQSSIQKLPTSRDYRRAAHH